LTRARAAMPARVGERSDLKKRRVRTGSLQGSGNRPVPGLRRRYVVMELSGSDAVAAAAAPAPCSTPSSGPSPWDPAIRTFTRACPPRAGCSSVPSARPGLSRSRASGARSTTRCWAAGISRARLARLVRLGLVEPDVPGSSVFTAGTAGRPRRMLRLHGDLGVGPHRRRDHRRSPGATRAPGGGTGPLRGGS
jgi:hypothetical protein